MENLDPASVEAQQTVVSEIFKCALARCQEDVTLSSLLQAYDQTITKHGISAGDLAGIQIYRALLQWSRQQGPSSLNRAYHTRASVDSALQPLHIITPEKLPNPNRILHTEYFDIKSLPEQKCSSNEHRLPVQGPPPRTRSSSPLLRPLELTSGSIVGATDVGGGGRDRFVTAAPGFSRKHTGSPVASGQHNSRSNSPSYFPDWAPLACPARAPSPSNPARSSSRPRTGRSSSPSPPWMDGAPLSDDALLSFHAQGQGGLLGIGRSSSPSPLQMDAAPLNDDALISYDIQGPGRSSSCGSTSRPQGRLAVEEPIARRLAAEEPIASRPLGADTESKQLLADLWLQNIRGLERESYSFQDATASCVDQGHISSGKLVFHRLSPCAPLADAASMTELASFSGQDAGLVLAEAFAYRCLLRHSLRWWQNGTRCVCIETLQATINSRISCNHLLAWSALTQWVKTVRCRGQAVAAGIHTGRKRSFLVRLRRNFVATQGFHDHAAHKFLACFLAWRESARSLARCHQSSVRLQQSLKRQRSQIVLRHWLLRQSMRNSFRARLMDFRGSTVDRCFRAIFAAWRAVLNHSNTIHVTAQACLRRKHIGLKRLAFQGFTSWCAHSRDRKEIRCRGQLLSASIGATRMKLLFDMLHKLAFVSQRNCGRGNRVCNQCLLAWRRVARFRAQCHNSALWLQQSVDRRRGKMLLRHWLIRQTTRKNFRARLINFRGRTVDRWLRAAFAVWSIFSKHMSSLQGQVESSFERAQLEVKRQTLQCLALWCMYSCERNEALATMSDVYRRKCGLRHGIRRLRAHVHQQAAAFMNTQRRRTNLQRAWLLRWYQTRKLREDLLRRNIAARGWAQSKLKLLAWTAWVTMQSERRQIVAHWRVRAMKSAARGLSYWRTRTKRNSKMSKMLRMVRDWSESKLKRFMWTAWLTFLKEMQVERRQISAHMRARTLRCASSGMRYWHICTKNHSKLREVQRIVKQWVQSKTKLVVWTCWLEFLKEIGAERRQISIHRRARALHFAARGLRDWHERTAHSSRIKSMQRIVRQTTRAQRARLSFKWWHASTHEAGIVKMSTRLAASQRIREVIVVWKRIVLSGRAFDINCIGAIIVHRFKLVIGAWRKEVFLSGLVHYVFRMRAQQTVQRGLATFCKSTRQSRLFRAAKDVAERKYRTGVARLCVKGWFHHVRRCASWRVCIDVMQAAINKRISCKCLRAWSACAHWMLEVRCRGQAFTASTRAAWKRRFLGHLQKHVFAAQEFRRRVAQKFRACLVAWHQVARLRARCHHYSLGLQQKIQHQRGQTLLRKWLLRQTSRKSFRVRLMDFRVRTVDRWLRATVVAWRAVFKRMNSMQVQVEVKYRRKQFELKRQTLRSFALWCVYSCERSEVRCRGQALTTSLHASRMRCVFAELQRIASVAQELRDHVVRRFRTYLLAWRQVARSRARCHHSSMELQQNLQHRRIHMLLEYWFLRQTIRKHIRANLIQFRERAADRRLRARFAAWCLLCERMKSTHAQVERAFARKQIEVKAKTLRCFALWRVHSFQRKDAVATAIEVSVVSILRSRFASWVSTIALIRRREERVLAVSLRHIMELLRIIFDIWATAWLLYQHLQSLNTMAHHFLKRSSMHIAKATFAAWFTTARRMVRMETRQSLQLDDLRRRRRSRLSMTIMSAWHDEMICAKRKAHRAHIARVLRCWQLYTQEQTLIRGYLEQCSMASFRGIRSGDRARNDVPSADFEGLYAEMAAQRWGSISDVMSE